jgi:hypothetical protein
MYGDSDGDEELEAAIYGNADIIKAVAKYEVFSFLVYLSS